MQKIKLTILLLIFVVLATNTTAQVEPDNATRYLLHFQFDSLEIMLNRAEYKDYFYYKHSSLLHFGKMLLQFNRENLNVFYQLQEDLLKELESAHLATDDNIAAQLDIHFQSLLIAAMAADNSSLVRSGLRYNNLIKKVSRKAFNEDMHIKKHIKIHSIIQSLIVNEIPISRFLIQAQSDLNNELNEFSKLAIKMEHSSDYFELVIWDYLFQINLKENVDYINTLSKKYPLHAFLSAYIERQRNRNDEVLKITSQLNEHMFKACPFIYFLHAEALLRKMDVASIQYFEQFIKSESGELLHYTAIKQLEWAYLLFEIPKEKQLKVDFSRKSWLSIDTYYLNTGNYNNEAKCLLTARLFYDGGYYTEAIQELIICENTISTESEYYNEFLYRKAKAYIKVNRLPDAILTVNELIGRSSASGSIFAPNASFALATFCEENQFNFLAQLYYEKTLEYFNYSFENSLRKKTLSRLSKF
jgi:hypothetical protein